MRAYAVCKLSWSALSWALLLNFRSSKIGTWGGHRGVCLVGRESSYSFCMFPARKAVSRCFKSVLYDVCSSMGGASMMDSKISNSFQKGEAEVFQPGSIVSGLTGVVAWIHHEIMW